MAVRESCLPTLVLEPSQFAAQLGLASLRSASDEGVATAQGPESEGNFRVRPWPPWQRSQAEVLAAAMRALRAAILRLNQVEGRALRTSRENVGESHDADGSSLLGT